MDIIVWKNIVEDGDINHVPTLTWQKFLKKDDFQAHCILIIDVCKKLFNIEPNLNSTKDQIIFNEMSRLIPDFHGEMKISRLD